MGGGGGGGVTPESTISSIIRQTLNTAQPIQSRFHVVTHDEN